MSQLSLKLVKKLRVFIEQKMISCDYLKAVTWSTDVLINTFIKDNCHKTCSLISSSKF